MPDSPSTEGRERVHEAWREAVASIRSDMLAQWHEVLRAIPALAQALGVPNQLRLVIDANVVLADLRWMVKKRTNPEARPILQEVIASGTIAAYAPPLLRAEVEKGLQDLAREEGLAHAQLVAAWGSYQGLFRYVEPLPSLSATDLAAVRDPNDQPYIDLRVSIDASAIYSEDPDLRGMEAPVVGQRVLTAARTYARAASISFTLKIGGVTVLAAGIAVLALVAKALIGGVRAIRQLPAWVQYLLAAGAVLALLHPPTRRWLRARLGSLSETARHAFQEALPLVAAAADQAGVAARRAEGAWGTVRAALPATAALAPQPLRVHVLVACVEAHVPLSTEEIADRVLRQGYRAGVRPSAAYLQRVLRSHPAVERTPDGRWHPRAT